LLRAAAASGPESMLEVGAENPELAEAIRTSLSAQGMAAPSPVNTEVACRASTCRISVVITSEESQDKLRDRVKQAVRQAVGGRAAGVMGMPPMQKGTSKERSIEFLGFVTVNQ
jgi:hypothetical protein